MSKRKQKEISAEIRRAGIQCFVGWGLLLLCVLMLPLISDVSWTQIIFAEAVGIGVLLFMWHSLSTKDNKEDPN